MKKHILKILIEVKAKQKLIGQVLSLRPLVWLYTETLHATYYTVPWIDKITSFINVSCQTKPSSSVSIV